MAYNFKNLADVELLGAMPENANVFVEVDGATKRAPSAGLGGGMLYDMPDVVVFTSDAQTQTFTCNKTFAEVFNLIKNNELRLTVATGLMEGYMMLPMQMAAPFNSNGNFALDDTVTYIAFQEIVMNLSLYLLNDNTITMTDPTGGGK